MHLSAGMSLHERAGVVGSDPVGAPQAAVAPILVPVDLSPRAKEVVRRAARVAGWFGCVAEVLHVVQLSIAGEERGIPRTRLLNGLAEEAQLKLWRLVDEYWESATGLTVTVRVGCPHEVIVEEAVETGACMIVMGGSQGKRWRLPGTGIYARVTRDAPCPVMTVSQRGCEAMFWQQPWREVRRRGPRFSLG
jgi:nucleotide-binding universal stress UspA family protein